MHQPPNTHLAQLNVAHALDDMTSPLLAGFVWRLKDDNGNAADIHAGETNWLIAPPCAVIAA